MTSPAIRRDSVLVGQEPFSGCHGHSSIAYAWPRASDRIEAMILLGANLINKILLFNLSLDEIRHLYKQGEPYHNYRKILLLLIDKFLIFPKMWNDKSQ